MVPQPGHVYCGNWNSCYADRLYMDMVSGEKSQGRLHIIPIFLILFSPLLFANFAEAIAEARGKAQADQLAKNKRRHPRKKNFSCW